jgi:general secretion pathway protein H
MAQKSKYSLQAGGFTLYELLAVMVLMAVLAGTVAVSVRGHVSNARLLAFLDRLESCDARARAQARRLNHPLVLKFDADDQRVSQSYANVAERSFAAPLGVEIEQIKTAKQESDHGILQIAVSPLGQSDTYALRLQASSGRSMWLVVLGASGQCLRLYEGADVEDIFSLQR